VSQESFAAWILQRRPQDQYLVLNHAHFPLEIDVRYPERVGTDRLAAAVAANLGRSPDRGIIVIDAGTAITVDLLTPDGVFRGGAILPGLETAAAALAAATDALPHVELRGPSAAPSAIGKSTADAILSGLVWGCVGAVRELIARISEEAGLDPELCCTGGAGRLLAQLLGPQCLYDPQLVLRGIALTGWQLGSVPDD
jgi:type III pantothenate kinase